MIDPFRIQVSPQVIQDVRQRLDRTRWPADVADTWEDGANPTYLRELVEYWRTKFDWRAQESRLNQLSHFLATIDGVVALMAVTAAVR
jgi:hypothetical protein